MSVLHEPRAPWAPAATIVAFDGVVADTLGLRANALDAALASVAERFGLRERIHSADSRALISGRTLGEAARALLPLHFTNAVRDAPPLEALVDLVAMDAGKRYADALSNGVSLCSDAEALLSTVASTGRVASRADSARRDVEAILSLAGLDTAFAFVRCSDDAPRQAGAASIESSWIAVNRRLLASGVPIANRTAIETSERGLEAARPFAALVERPRFQDGDAG